jgi:hypothetical protein
MTAEQIEEINLQEKNQLIQETDDSINMRVVGWAAQETLKPLSIDVTGIKWAMMPNPRDGRPCISVSFQVEAPQNYFGTNYSDPSVVQKRRDTMGALFTDRVMSEMTSRFPDNLVYLDILPTPAKDILYTRPRPMKETLAEDAQIVPVSELLVKGRITEDSEIYRTATRYGLTEVCMSGGQIVSPDPSTVEMFQHIQAASHVGSVLEIGGGVSPIALQAQRTGIKDVTIVDYSSNVYTYLKSRQPDYQVLRGNALDRDFMLPILNRSYDLVILGIDYELQPEFMKEFGEILGTNATWLVVQSGSPGFYQFEHNALMGEAPASSWSWWDANMRVGKHFRHVDTKVFSFQHLIVATSQNGMLESREFQSNLKQAGFHNFQWDGEVKI